MQEWVGFESDNRAVKNIVIVKSISSEPWWGHLPLGGIVLGQSGQSSSGGTPEWEPVVSAARVS